MIYSGKTVSVREVIAKVYRDLGLTEEDLFIDFVEWSAEALDQIGTFTQLDSKTTTIDISNYKGELPDDFVYPDMITYNNIPLLSTDNTPDKIDMLYPKEPYSPYLSKYKNATYVSHTGFEHPTEKQLDGLKYQISSCYIKTGFESGCLKMTYKSLPLDCDGLPLIPDYVEFREAVYWYINMKQTYKMWRVGSIRDGIYQHAEGRWNFYCQQAASKAMIPDLAMLEKIKRNYLKLKPNVERFQELFK